MELIDALLSEKWLLSSALALGYLLQRQERLADKKDFMNRINALTDALDAIKDRIR